MAPRPTRPRLIAAIDGKLDRTNVDKVRVKLTDRTTGAVVFDTNPGAPDSAERTVPQAGQVWFPDSALKTAHAMEEFDAEGLPIVDPKTAASSVPS